MRSSSSSSTGRGRRTDSTTDALLFGVLGAEAEQVGEDAETHAGGGGGVNATDYFPSNLDDTDILDEEEEGQRASYAAGGKVSGLLTPTQTAVSIVKCAIGAGSFSLPYAFEAGGLYMSFILTVCLGVLSAYTIVLLGKCERTLIHRVAGGGSGHANGGGGDEGILSSNGGLDEDDAMGMGGHNTTSDVKEDLLLPKRIRMKLTYPEVGAHCFPNATFTMRGKRYNIMSTVCYAGIVATSIGVCGAYFLFLVGTLPSVFPELSYGATIAIVLPLLLALSYLRNFKLLSFTSVLGDVAVTAGIVAVIAYGADEHGHKADMALQFVDADTLPVFFGSTAFLFAIHIVVLPIMQSMKQPERFAKTVYISYGFITAINALFGAVCYILYVNTTCHAQDDDDGLDGPCPNILDSIQGSIVLDIVKILVCVDLLFTVPMVLAAGREILEDGLIAIFHPHHQLDADDEPRDVSIIRYSTRTMLVLLVFAVTVAVPDFEDMVGLVGGTVNSFMGYILPPIFYLRLFRGKLSTLSVIGHYLIVLFGAFALIISTFFVVSNIAESH